jgi:hypothetical protein
MRSIQRALVLMLGLASGASLMAQIPNPKSTFRPLTYGTSAVSYIEVSAEAFRPSSSGTDYFNNTGPYWVSSDNCSGYACFVAPLHLPSGALVVYLELDYYDTNGFDDVYGTLVDCDFLGENCTNHPVAGAGPAGCLTPGLVCSGTSGGTGNSFGDLTPDGITVDNYVKSYRLTAGHSALDGSNQIAGMIVGYVLQVSPAPGMASFNDVPTSHRFFQFIEALKASGITGGCQTSPPLYCPNDPLTRGQMAVFLAKALGLQWQ